MPGFHEQFARRSRAACLALGLGLLAGPAWSDTAAPDLLASPAQPAPVLDGDVLGDPAWAGVPAASEFWQTTPDDGEPASERTEVRVAYTADTLYVGVVCFDREPDRIIVSESRRDASLEGTDSFQMILDTYRDRQNGFVFGTNPAGIEYDGQVRNEGEGSGSGPGMQQSGAGGGFNRNWDGVWEVRTRVGDFGWSAEFAIPFRTLRYGNGREQVWGANFQRNIERRKERAYWAPLSRQFNLYRLSSAGSLRGIGVPSQRNLKVTPYVLGESVRELGSVAPSTDRRGDAGFDLKYGITPSVTLDATVNTDFAQVEVDELQINLDRFNLFYPEKRPFFLENAGLFAVGSPGEVELFFSRRIGIGPEGEVIPILAGGRVSGKLLGMNVGVLEIQTRSVDDVAPANNFAVARLSRELPNRSGLGAVFINRQATGSGQSSDWNRTLGVDGRWGIGRHGQLSGYAAKTWTPGVTAEDYSYQLAASHSSPGWELSAKFTEVGEGFNPEVGFLRRTAFRKPEALVLRRYRPPDLLGLLEVRPHVSYRGYWTPDGFQETGFLHVDNHLEWRNGYEFHTGVNFTREGLQSPFEIYPGVVVPPGTYDHAEVQVVLQTNEGAPVSFDGTLTVGGFFGGHRTAVRPTLKARVGDTFSTDLRWERNDVDLPWGRFVTNLLGARLSYSFTPRLFVQALVQYNDRAEIWTTNLRLGWLQAGGSGLFIVYNETWNTTSAAASLRNRSITLKLSRLFDLLD